MMIGYGATSGPWAHELDPLSPAYRANDLGGSAGAGLLNFADSIGAFGCTSLSSTVDWPSVQVMVQWKGNLDAGDIAIIGIVGLRGNDADCCGRYSAPVRTNRPDSLSK